MNPYLPTYLPTYLDDIRRQILHLLPGLYRLVGTSYLGTYSFRDNVL